MQLVASTVWGLLPAGLTPTPSCFFRPTGQAWSGTKAAARQAEAWTPLLAQSRPQPGISPCPSESNPWPFKVPPSRGVPGGRALAPTPPLGNVREGPDALGRVPDVPHLDVGGGHGEHEPGVAAVLNGDHVVGVTLQSRNLLARHQVPHLTAAVCVGAEGQGSWWGPGRPILTSPGVTTAGGCGPGCPEEGIPRGGGGARPHLLPGCACWTNSDLVTRASQANAPQPPQFCQHGQGARLQ